MEKSTDDPVPDLMKRWLTTVIEEIQTRADEDQQRKILERCGRACARPDVQRVRSLKEKAKNEEELLELLNQIPWCGTWVRNGSVIYSRCTRCGCPLIQKYYKEIDPLFCHCSLGWVKAIFSEAFGREIRAELTKALTRGDGCCEFVVDVGQ